MVGRYFRVFSCACKAEQEGNGNEETGGCGLRLN